MANNNAIFNAVIAGAGGANQERWIQSSNSASYAAYRTVIEEIATAVDAAIPAGTIDASQQALMQSVCQGVFAGRYPQASSYSTIAEAIVALYTQLSAGLLPVSTPGGTADPIYQQFWVDTTKPDGGNGAISSPFNAWADAVAAAVLVISAPSVIFLAQGLDASGTPIPNYGAGAHEVPTLKLQGPIQSSYYSPLGINVTNLVVQAQDGDDFALEVVDMNLVGASFPSGCILQLNGENAIISTLSEAGPSVFGNSDIVNCSLNGVDLPSWNLRMRGGTVDNAMSVDNAILDSVEFESACQFRFATSMTLTNCRFQTGAQILVSASQTLTLDLDSWGAMVAAGVTFPDTTPTLVIVPPPARTQTITPTLGTLNSGPAYTTFNVPVVGLEIGDSVCAAMRDNHDVDNYALVQASVRTADSVDLTFLKLDAGTIDVGLVSIDLGIIEAP